ICRPCPPTGHVPRSACHDGDRSCALGSPRVRAAGRRGVASVRPAHPGWPGTGPSTYGPWWATVRGTDQCGNVGVTVTAGEPPKAGGQLGGGHVLLTGSTGFLGQAVLERLLRDWPDTRVSLLIRGRGSSSAAERLGGLLRKPVFNGLRDKLGADGLAAAVAARVSVVDARLGSSEMRLPGDLTAVIHCAGTVSFDAPIDDAF